MRTRCALLPALAVVLLASLASPAIGQRASAPYRPAAGVDSPFVRDSFGRATFFHGVNAVWKLPPYYPPSQYFGDRDARWLAENGINNVRLGVLFAGVMPQRGVVDGAYLDRIADLVRMLGRYGVTVLLDFHQDMYNERFQGEGFPDWATIDDGMPATNCCGFPGNYFTPTVMHTFDNLWLNRDGLWEQYAAAWAAVAARFRDAPNVIGYDLLNEPWPGTQWWTCANPLGCPQFDAGMMQPFYETVIAAIRQADPTGIVWWEPNVDNNGGAPNDVGLVHPITDPGNANGISFHDYCILGGGFVPGLSRTDDPECPVAEDLVFQQQGMAAGRNNSALLLSEFGASDETVDIGRVAALADRDMVSWDYWAFGAWKDPTGNPAEEGLWRNDLDRPGSLKQEKADVLIRAYPQAVAGTPTSFAFDPESKRFTLEFQTDPAISAPTVIFLPDRHYGGGYAVEVTGPARVTSKPGARLLTLVNTGPGTVDVAVSPS